MKNSIILLAISLFIVSNASAESALIWGKGQWGINIWSALTDRIDDPHSDTNVDHDHLGGDISDINDELALDTTGSLDTDGDGLFNNSDTDDDNDGYTDQHELEMGSDPLDSSDIPRSGGLSPSLLYILNAKKIETMRSGAAASTIVIL